MNPPQLKCPACKSPPLEEVTNQEVPFLGCAECLGLFVRQADLVTYVARESEQEEVGKACQALLEEALGTQGSPSIRACPFCKEPLGRMGFGESPFLILDACQKDKGLWLDKRELKKILRSARAHAAVLGLIPHPGLGEYDEEEEEN